MRLSAAIAQTVTVAFATANGTATAPADYATRFGHAHVPARHDRANGRVSVVGDRLVERDEAFMVALSAPSGATLADGQATGTIVDDDLPPIAGVELAHGAVVAQDLPSGHAGRTDTFRLAQQARSSYEVVVDAASGDVSPAALERLAADQHGPADGRRDRHRHRPQPALDQHGPAAVVNQAAARAQHRLQTACGADDTYRVRAWETTYAIPRFNHSGTQGTVLVVQNATARTVAGRAYFWSAAGSLLGRRTRSTCYARDARAERRDGGRRDRSERVDHDRARRRLRRALGQGGRAGAVHRLQLRLADDRPPAVAPSHPTWIRGRSSGFAIDLRSTSRVTGAVSPSPSARYLRT